MTTSSQQLSGVPPAGQALEDFIIEALPPWWVLCIAGLLFAGWLMGKK